MQWWEQDEGFECTVDKNERHAARQRKWRAENPDKARAILKRYAEANPEKLKQTHSEWCERNREHLSISKRKYREANSDKVKQQIMEWRQKNKAQIKAEYHRRKYGLTPEAFNRMLSDQENKCLVCKLEFGAERLKTPHVDHCHETGVIRGLLCCHCNQGLGHFRDNSELLAAAIQYLNTPRTPQ